MGALSWLTGVGLPTLAAFACFAGAAAAWFRIPVLGHYFGLALACVGVALMANAKGFSDARAMCNEAAVRAELAQVRADLAKTQRAEADALAKAGALSEAQRKNEELADAISRIPDVCIADDGHIKRLLGVR